MVNESIKTEQKYYIGDSRDILKKYSSEIPEINLVVTSPPYNAGMEYETDLSVDEYYNMLVDVYKCCYDVMHENSRICVNVPFSITNKRLVEMGAEDGIFSPMYVNLKALIDSGFKFRDIIVWNQLVDGTKGKRSDTAWGSWRSASAPYIKHKCECIIIMYKGTWKLNRKGISDMSSDEFMSYVTDLWTFSGVSGKEREMHPAPFPIELAVRCIKLLSYVGDWVLDPFVGRGTVLRACRMLSRNGIGIEKCKKYEKVIREFSMINYGNLSDYLIDDRHKVRHECN